MLKRATNNLLLAALCVLAGSCGLAAAVQNQASRDVLTRPAPAADHRLAYGPDRLQFGELRLPQGAGPHPVVIVIHGGCWLAEYDFAYTGHLAAALTAAGVATWNIEYRRLGDSGGGWPGTFADVARATDHLRELAQKYLLDLNRVVAVGHSAGGHLALWLAARKRLPPGSQLHAPNPLLLRGVVALAGITDLRRTGTACDAEAKRLVTSSAPDAAAHYQQASPIELLPLSVKQVVIQGGADKIVPSAMARNYEAAARRKGDDVKLVLLEQAGHFEPVDPKSSVWPKVAAEILMLAKADQPAKGK